MARIIPSALALTSRHSVAGTESRTMLAPDWMTQSLPRTCMVRMVIALSSVSPPASSLPRKSTAPE